MKRFFQTVAFSVFALSIAAQAQNIFVAQTFAGRNTGNDCPNARALSSLTSGDWVPGNTIHLCGTITASAGAAGLVAQGSGTSDSPITVKFETGAVLQSPYFGGSGLCWSLASCNAGIEVYGNNYIVIDGGTNGVIQDTANGTNLANHQNSAGVVLSGNGLILRNLAIKGIYANDPTSGTDWAGQYTADVVVASGSTNITVCNNALSNARSGIAGRTSSTTVPSWPLPSCAANAFSSGVNVFGNTLRDHCWHFSFGGTNGNVVNIFNNDYSGVSNWAFRPNQSSYYHTDGVIAYGDSGAQVIVYFFNNYAHDTAYGTAAFFCDWGQTPSGCAAYVFNNIFEVDAAEANMGVAVWLDGTPGELMGPYYVFNNTFVNNGIMLMLGPDSETVSIENNLVSEGTTSANNFYAKGYGSNSLPSILATADYNSFYGGRPYGPFGGAGIEYCWPSGCTSSPWVNTGFDTHSVRGNPQIDANFRPSGKSPVVNAGANLSSLCSVPGLGPLCYDKSGAARPLTGKWDIGAIEAPHPNPPAGLTGTMK